MKFDLEEVLAVVVADCPVEISQLALIVDQYGGTQILDGQIVRLQVVLQRSSVQNGKYGKS